MRGMLGTVDLNKRPEVYRTSNPKYIGRICVDLYPESIPTVASFATTREVSDWLIDQFGQEQFNLWFPGGIREAAVN